MSNGMITVTNSPETRVSTREEGSEALGLMTQAIRGPIFDSAQRAAAQQEAHIHNILAEIKNSRPQNHSTLSSTGALTSSDAAVNKAIEDLSRQAEQAAKSESHSSTLVQFLAALSRAISKFFKRDAASPYDLAQKRLQSKSNQPSTIPSR